MALKLQCLEEGIDMGRASVNGTLESQDEETRLLSAEIEALTNDCNHVNVNKATLEYEINVYKRLLDSQLDRFGLKKVELASCGAVEAAKREEVAKKTTSEVLVTNETFGGHVKNRKEKKGLNSRSVV